jgi:hypothetical protein
MGAKECDNLISYLVGELPDSEVTSFKNHLKHCRACSVELEDMEETWFALSYDRDDKEAPKGLKEDVMNYLFREQSKESFPSQLLSNWIKVFKRKLSPLLTGLIAVFLICVLGLGWNEVHLRDIILDHEEVAQKGPILIKDTFILQPKNQSSKLSGIVYLAQEGKEKWLFMHLHQLPKTEGTEVYQAWLLYEGKYHSCGTFRSNQSGEGVLTYLVPPNVQYKGFEITLEPNAGASQPHGQTIMRTF